MGKFNKNLRHGNKNKNRNIKRKKIMLEFDEKQREEYLTGFRKRKNERRQKAKEEMQAILKMEKKRIKKQKEQEMEIHMEQCKEALRAVESSVLELPDHTVTVTQLDTRPLYSISQNAHTSTTEKPMKISSTKKRKLAKMSSLIKKKAGKIQSSKKKKPASR